MYKRHTYGKIKHMKRRLRRPFLTVMKIVLLLIFISFSVVTTLFIWNLVNKTQESEKIQPGDEKIQAFEYAINSYTLFDLEELEYRFILASIHVTSNKSINLSLAHFTTSEGIQLNAVDNYLQQLESIGYNFGDYPVVFGINSQDTQSDALLFIPIVDRSLTYLDVDISLNPKSTLSFDLLNPSSIGKIGNLGVNPSNLNSGDIAEATILRGLEVSPDNFYQLDSSGLRVQANFTAQSQIIGIKFTLVNKTTESFRISKATLTATNGASYEAVDNTYLIDGIQNLSNILVETEATGYLFFEVLGSESLSDLTSLNLYFSTAENKEPLSVPLENLQ